MPANKATHLLMLKKSKRLFQKGTPAPGAAARTPQINCGYAVRRARPMKSTGLVDAEKVENDFFRKPRRLQAPLRGRRK
jgi:hypothetical protein